MHWKPPLRANWRQTHEKRTNPAENEIGQENEAGALKTGRTAASERRKGYGFPTKSRAIREKCRDCQGEGEQWIRNCDIIDCPLWPYRMGRSPKEADLQVAQIDNLGNVTGYRHYRDAK